MKISPGHWKYYKGAYWANYSEIRDFFAVEYSDLQGGEYLCYPCPKCKIPLSARRWEKTGNQRRTVCECKAINNIIIIS